MSRTPALTRDAVKRARLAYFHRKETLQAIADRRGVAVSTIFKVVHGHPPYHPKYRRKENSQP